MQNIKQTRFNVFLICHEYFPSNHPGMIKSIMHHHYFLIYFKNYLHFRGGFMNYFITVAHEKILT